MCVQQSPMSSRRGSADANSKAVSIASAGPLLGQAAGDGTVEQQQPLFTSNTKSIIWGMQSKAVQGMMDFDYVCSRKEPSVVAMIYPFV